MLYSDLELVSNSLTLTIPLNKINVFPREAFHIQCLAIHYTVNITLSYDFKRVWRAALFARHLSQYKGRFPSSKNVDLAG